MGTAVVIPGGWLKKIKSYLFDGSGNEFCCYIFSGSAKTGRDVRLIGRKLALPDKDTDYELSTGGSCKPTLHYIDNILYDSPRENDLIRHNLSIIDIHCHPFSKGQHVHFSGIDERWQAESVQYFFQIREYTGYHCFIVMGENSFDGRVWYWDYKQGRAKYLTLDQIIALDYPYCKIENPNRKRKVALNSFQKEVFDRQILAFGTQGQAVMSSVTAAIVGVGGLGSFMAKGLARLGVNRQVLVDHDCAETSNLNRCLGMTYADAQAKVPKTAIAAREIYQINPNANVLTVNEKVFSRNAVQKLKMTDFIVLCTDNLASRAFVNELCLQYGIPLFSLGTVINVEKETGQIVDVFAEYYLVVPGENTCCLNCCGAVDYHAVSYILSAPEVLNEGKARGYVNMPDFHQPAVLPINSAIAAMALSEIHDFFCGFKHRITEGLGYDQLRNKIYRKDFLHCSLEEAAGGTFFEAEWNTGSFRLTINGEGQHTMPQNVDPLIWADTLPLNGPSEMLLKRFLEKVTEDLKRKKECPYCGQSGLLGRADNEPMTSYPENI